MLVLAGPVILTGSASGLSIDLTRLWPFKQAPAQAVMPTPSPTDAPGTQPGTYEPAEPGDRLGPGKPSMNRVMLGMLDGPPSFVSRCSYSHSANDDPIVFPSQPGASHLHDFFGNKATDAFSSDDSLRNGGQTTCAVRGDSSAYWVPALYENGEYAQPGSIEAYYQAAGKDFRRVEPFPQGLKMLVKDSQAYMWFCVAQGSKGWSSKTPPRCPQGEHLQLEIRFPDCWDGKYLDVPDHRSHMAYSLNGSCPTSHPVPLTELKIFVNYPTAHGGDVILAPLFAPSNPHADFVNSWDQFRLFQLVRDCINAGVQCGANPPA